MQPGSAEMTVPFVVDTLARERTVWVRECTDSMAPLVRAGDRLHLAAADRRDIRPGALVAFRSGGILVVHRVLAVTTAGLITKGDALERRDPPVPWDAVVARVIAVAHDDRISALADFPCTALARAFAALSRTAEMITPSRPGIWWRRPAWRLARVPFYVVARLTR
jgi:hypothetical protein